MSDFELALRVNIATNGRWFCAMMFALALSTGSILIAFAFASLVGVTCITDQFQGRVAVVISSAVYLLAALLSVILLIAIW